MKYLLSFWLLVFMTGCVGTGPSRFYVQDSNIVGPREEEAPQYELIVDEPGFESWMVTNARPIGFYTKSYYETKNRIYVSDWNDKVTAFRHRRRSPFTEIINYDFTIDYGIELNYKLFYYFKFMHQKYGRRYTFPN
ncbi:MAG: DUF6146 family protein [Cytophagales bacterium]|nr:DUF6146 family protein [Cytophagales bacterium]